MRLCAASRPGEQLAGQQQPLAGLPVRHLVARQPSSDTRRAPGVGRPVHLGPQREVGRLEPRRPAAVEREMNVPGRRAIRDHGHRQRRRVRRVVQHLDVEHRGQAPEALRADAERVDALVDLQPQLLELRFRARARSTRRCRSAPSATSSPATWPSRRCRRCRRRACPGGHQPAPMSGTMSSTQSATESEGFSIANMDLFSEPPPLAATVISTRSPGHQLGVNHRRRVVARVAALERRIGRRSRRAACCRDSR